MGAGTGPLITASDKYPVTLTFDHGGIDPKDPIYTNFLSALEWLLLCVRRGGGDFSITPNPAGPVIRSIDVVVVGPLKGGDEKKFNRAFNRLLWGLRHRRSQHTPPPHGPNPPQQYDSSRAVTTSDTYNADEET